VVLLLSGIPDSAAPRFGNRREERMRKNSDVKFSFPSRPIGSEEILPGRGEFRRTGNVMSMARSLVFVALR